MIISDQQRAENFQEYLLLLQDPNYLDVTFDDQSGGVSAIHIKHRFDNKTGAFGIKKGDYERIVVDILRHKGHTIILTSELAPNGIKTPDGYLDDVIMDIKAIESNGKWAIKDKLHRAAKQGAACVILYFHKKELFSHERMNDGWTKFLEDKDSKNYRGIIKRVLCIVEDKVTIWEIA
jgi:hypothetical protein